jgi:hypothetical protein
LWASSAGLPSRPPRSGAGSRIPPGVPVNSISERRRGGVLADGQRGVGMTELNRATLTTRAAPGQPAPTLGPSSVVLPGALWCSLSSRERNYPFLLGLRFKCMICDLRVTSISSSPYRLIPRRIGIRPAHRPHRHPVMGPSERRRTLRIRWACSGCRCRAEGSRWSSRHPSGTARPDP